MSVGKVAKVKSGRRSPNSSSNDWATMKRNSNRMENMQLFFVGTYSRGEGDIFTLLLDCDRTKLALGPVYTGCESPSFLALDNDCLYAVSECFAGGALCSFAVAGDGTLTHTASINAPYPGLCHIGVWPSRKAISVASYFGGGVVTCALQPDGALSADVQWLPNHGKGINTERQDQAHVHSLTPDLAGKYIVEADLGIDQLKVFRMEGTELVPHSEITVPDGEGPRHFLFHPNGCYAYLITELSNHVLLFDYDAATGLLAHRQTFALLDGNEGNTCLAADIHLTTDCRFLFASVRGVSHLIRFAVNADGTLTDRRFVPCGAEAVRNFCIETNGNFLLVADQIANEVRLFALEPESGELSVCLDCVHIPSPVCVING